MRRLLWLPLSVFCSAATVHAAPITYTFGSDGLKGSFVLDDRGVWDLQPTITDGLEGTLSSPRQHVHGSFGDWHFAGHAILHIFDSPIFRDDGTENIVPDSWIVRASNLAGNKIDGRSVEAIYFFVTTSLIYDVITTMVPAFPQGPGPSYSILFSDGSFSTDLVTLSPRVHDGPHKVPEPSGGLLLIAGASVALLKRQLCHHRRSGSALHGQVAKS